MLELLQPFMAAPDLGGRQHIVDLDTSHGPPWSALCGYQLQISQVAFKGRLKDDREQCTACVHQYQDALNPQKTTQKRRTSRPAPPRLDAPGGID